MVPASHVWRRLCVCAIAGLLAACETAHTRTSSSSDLTGRYGAETGLLYGDNKIGLVNGKHQSVMMTLAPRHGSYDVTWTNETSDLAQGIAIRSGNILAVARGKAPRDFWNDYENLGIAVYEEIGAELHGTLVFQGDPRRRTETQVLRWSDDSKDHLDIVSDSRRVDPQNGQVKVTRNGRAYLFAWFEPRLTFSGTAVKIGNTFVVALSSTNLPAVAAFCRDGDQLVGRGVLNASKSLTLEVMSPIAPTHLPDDMHPSECSE